MTPTANLGYQSFFQAQLTAGISASDLTIPLDVVPTPSEGFLVLESTSASKREIIYYTSKTVNSVVCPAGGRGYDGTTAQSHLQNSAVIMAPVAAMFSSMRSLFETTPQGWTPVTQTVSSVTYNGNRSYSLTMSASVAPTLSNGMRIRTTRTVTAPTQCTSLNGTTQYWNDTTITGMTFTDDFTVSAWIKLSSYPAVDGSIASRFNGTSGWAFFINPSGQVRLTGLNGGGGNQSRVTSFQSVPLNKWVHVSANLDMSAFSTNNDGGATGSCVMIDGVNVPAFVDRVGTNPTSLIQAGNLEIGSYNASAFFQGKIAQVAIFNTKITNATIRSYISQGLAGTETNLISAYSFNGNANDLNTTNANNLTAQASATATNADSPFAEDAAGVPTGTTDFGIVTNVATTTLTVQVPEGCAIPTSGGVSAISYSTQKAPYGMPVSIDKWEIISYFGSASTSPTLSVGFKDINWRITVPIGNWDIGFQTQYNMVSAASQSDIYSGFAMSTSTSSASDPELYLATLRVSGALSTLRLSIGVTRSKRIALSAATNYNLTIDPESGAAQLSSLTFSSRSYMYAIPAGL